MKTRYFGWAFLMGVMMTVAACSSEQGNMEMPQRPGEAEELVEYSFTAETGATRISVNDKVQTVWNVGDQVTMWIGTSKTDAQPYVFETNEDGVSNAAFHAMVPKSVNSLCYYAFYPAVKERTNDGKVTFGIPVDGTVRQNTANNSKHLAAYRTMYAPIVNRSVASTELTGVNFKQLTSLLVFDIMNMRKDMVDVSEVVVVANRPVFYEEATFEPGGENVMAEQTGEPVSSVTLSLGDGENGVKLDAQNGRMIAYLPLIPTASLEGASVKLMLKVNGQELASLAVSSDDLQAARVTRFEQGKFYIFYLDVLTSEIHWDTDKSIAEWENGGTIDIPV